MGNQVSGELLRGDGSRQDATLSQLSSTKYGLDTVSLPSVNSLINFQWDGFTVSYGSTTTDYVFTLGGDAAGTIRLTFSDASKENLTQAERL